MGRIMNPAGRGVVLSDVWRRAAAAWAPKATVDVINNPTHADYQQPHPTRAPASPPTVLYLGRIIPSKGIYDLLDAIPLIVSAYGDVRFRVAGNGETEAFLDACGRKGLDRYVDFLGWADEQTKRDAFASATLLVHPTHYEGFGRAIVEAMAASLPIVATRVGAIIDIVHDGENGLLVEPGDPAALATAVVTLLSDAGRRQSMAQANRAKAVERYSSSTIVDHWSKLYHALGAGDRT